MQEYPKALYFGTVQAHQHKVVNGPEHEAELRDLGFVDFSDLKKDTVKSMDETASGKASSEDFKNAFVSVDQYDAVCEKLVQAETQLGAAQNERDFFIEENQKLKEQLSKSTGINEETENTETNYSSMTSDQLRSILDAKGIKYLVRDNKETLIALLTTPVKTEE